MKAKQSIPALLILALCTGAQAQTYWVAEAEAAYYEAAAIASDLEARFIIAHALAGGECDGSSDICRDWASNSRERADLRRDLAESIRANPDMYNEPGPGRTAQDEAREYREIADEFEGGALLRRDSADRARRNAELGRNVRTWTRAAELAEDAAEAHEQAAKAARRAAVVFETQALIPRPSDVHRPHLEE